ncbi:MAG: EAL domain-containing protein [Myxococcota bacterium]
MRSKILVADDDAVTRILAGEAIRSAGFDVIEAEDGDVAWERYRTERPDAVLLDVQMPGLDGYAVCERIRQLPGGQATPVLVMTSQDDRASVERAYTVGATDFITKPLNGPLLGHRLLYLLRAAGVSLQAQQTAWRLSQAHRLARLVQWEWDPRLERMRWGDEWEVVFGPVDGVPELARLVHPDDWPEVEAAIASGQPHELEYRILQDDGSERIVHHEAELAMDQLTGTLRLIGAIQDVTERRRAERRVTELAYFDPLTGLPNRTYLRRYVQRAVTEAERHGETLALLALDLDLFKRVNDMLGHAAGDELLNQVSRRLTESIRHDDLVGMVPMAGADVPESDTLAARLGGDEFIVVLRRLRSPEEAGVVARRILDAVGQPYDLGGSEVLVSTSIGIVTCPENGTDVDTLMKNADIALYSAKDSGRNSFQFFNQAIQRRAQRRAEIDNGLRLALSRPGELDLHFQPKVAIPSERVTGVEALVRWNSPVLGRVSPAEFVAAAEETGLIVPLGEWVLRRACELATGWDGTQKDLTVAVNISGRQFQQPGFVELVAKILRETGLSPSRLEIEITETVVMQDTTNTQRVLRALKDLGVRIALDDFGTGYSSLSYLTRFPIDILKIDRSFVAGLEGASSEAIVSAIMALSRSLSLEVVAEGVETAGQLSAFERYGELDVQGFYFARPMDDVSWRAWLAQNSPRVARPTAAEAASRASPPERSHAPTPRNVPRYDETPLLDH